MPARCTLILAFVALLAGCASTSAPERLAHWNDGIWNSVLGYHGPTNVVSAPAGP